VRILRPAIAIWLFAFFAGLASTLPMEENAHTMTAALNR
jgi:hypothetical protein